MALLLLTIGLLALASGLSVLAIIRRRPPEVIAWVVPLMIALIPNGPPGWSYVQLAALSIAIFAVVGQFLTIRIEVLKRMRVEVALAVLTMIAIGIYEPLLDSGFSETGRVILWGSTAAFITAAFVRIGVLLKRLAEVRRQKSAA